MDLSGRIAIVTGAGRGLGGAIAKKLADDGANVVINDVIIENANLMADEIKKAGGEAIAIAGSIAEYKDVLSLFEAAKNIYGRVDIVVNNAGINKDSMLHKMTIEQWDQVISVNLTGTFYVTKEAAKHMREQKSGRIINISSASWLGNIGQANYAASKAGVIGLTKTASRELARSGVTCNAICPGFIDTDMTRAIPEKAWDIMISKIPMGKAGKGEDVANMVAFLASDEASYITGEIINVGGGMIL